MNAKNYDSPTRTLPFRRISADSIAYARDIFIKEFDLPITHMWVKNQGWSDIVCDKILNNLIDPSSKHEDIMKGNMAVLLGMTVMTDAFDSPETKEPYEYDFQLYNEVHNKAINFLLIELPEAESFFAQKIGEKIDALLFDHIDDTLLDNIKLATREAILESLEVEVKSMGNSIAIEGSIFGKGFAFCVNAVRQ